MPVSSDISITKNGTNITNKVIFSTARFDGQSSAGVGTFQFVCKDVNQTLSFKTGDEIVLWLDGVRYFGGWVMQATAQFAFPAVDTTTPANVTTRQWMVQGVNYNVLFDRLVLRNPANYTRYVDVLPGTTKAGQAVTYMCQNYLDIPAGFNVTTYVDDVSFADVYQTEFVYKNGGQQGITWREEMQWISMFNGAIYYIDANKRLHYHAPEKVFSRWGFSDQPNKLGIGTSTGTKQYLGSTYGFRDMEATEDISSIVNDVFVWGGSEFVASDTPGASGTVFARRTNPTSISNHGRWQLAEIGFGELGGQEEVDARAAAIVPPDGQDNPPGVGSDGVIRNRSKPSWSIRLSWFSHDVPAFTNNDTKDHLIPGDITTITLYVHGNPLIQTLPLRRVGVSFPTVPSSTGGAAKTFVRFDGEFGLSLDDPFNLWEAILNKRRSITRTVKSIGSATTTASSGSRWYGKAHEDADGTRTVFSIRSNGKLVPYIATSSRVWVSGLLYRQGSDYTEQPSAGTITFMIAPGSGAVVLVEAQIA